MALMALFCFAPIFWFGREQAFKANLEITLSSLATGIAAAWGWWSVAAPRWRLWAYRRVDDPDRLQVLAVESQLVWPAWHPFTRTEFRGGEPGKQLRAYEERMSREWI